MARTVTNAVKGILGRQYDGETSLLGFIETATALVTEVDTCATAMGVTLSSTMLELIERWLAAHYYAHSDQLFAKKKTGDASATFQGEFGKGLDSTQYGQTAKRLDTSGCLASLDKGSKASMEWLGLPVSEQTDYIDRD